ncbi:MAG: serine/threonine protein kinase [Bdellovibrionales bacterium]|nr:serine/threonine protein kinase [Bdellovibrionales bacterium]
MKEFSLSEEELFAGRYKVLRHIGQGGMGEVYLVADTILGNEEVALKILRSDFSTDEKHVQRFLREVSLTRKVTHPNIVRTFDVGVDTNNNLYFTMEYVTGHPLGERIERGPSSVDDVCRILMQVCDGLTAIHQENIVHRDLKPGNVIEMEDGTVKITDFGVARPGVSNLTGRDEIVGSSHYMAPEVWVGRDISTPADIYALGVLGYELLTGCLPFDADNPAELMWKHLEEKPVQPAELSIEVPDWLNQLILALLEKDQNKRPMFASEVKDYIRRYYTGTGLYEHFDVLQAATIDGDGTEVVVPNPHETGEFYNATSTGEYDLESPLSAEMLLEVQDGEEGEDDIFPESKSAELEPAVLRAKKNKQSSVSAIDPSEMFKRQGALQVLTQLGMAAVLPSLIGLLLCGPVLNVLLSQWRGAMESGEAFLALIFIGVQIVVYSLLFSLPLLSLALVRRNIKDSFQIVFPFFLAFCITIVGFTAYRGSSLLGEHGSWTVGLVAKASSAATKSVVVSGAQVAMLSPFGSAPIEQYIGDKLIFAPDQTKLFSWEHLGFFLIMMFMFTRAIVFHLLPPGRFEKPKAHLWLLSFSSVVIALELVAVKFLLPVLGMGVEVKWESVRLGRLMLAAPMEGWWLGGAHWLLFLVVILLAPSLQKKS